MKIRDRLISILICVGMLSACAVTESTAQPIAIPDEKVEVSSSAETVSPEEPASSGDGLLLPSEQPAEPVEAAGETAEQPAEQQQTESEAVEQPAEQQQTESEAAEQEVTVTVETVTLMEGEPEQTDMFIFRTNVPGERFFIVGGIHGDEEAGWRAARQLRKEIESELKSGTLYLLPVANITGARALTRHMSRSGDLNRAFPGDKNDQDPAFRLAAEIFEQVEAADPVFMLDLHEARKSYREGSVGDTLIFTGDNTLDLIWDFMVDNEDKSITETEFTMVNPAVKGSINRTVSDLLGYPVITVETLRSKPLEDRIADQLIVVRYCLEYYGLI